MVARQEGRPIGLGTLVSTRKMVSPFTASRFFSAPLWEDVSVRGLALQSWTDALERTAHLVSDAPQQLFEGDGSEQGPASTCTGKASATTGTERQCSEWYSSEGRRR